MKFKTILFLLLSVSATQAQTFIYPVISAHGKTIKSLIPPQWKVIDSAYGDLNNDAEADLALIYEFYAAVKEKRAYGDNNTDLITEIQKPRILAIYFKAGRNYKLAVQNNNFILRSEEGGATGDPLRPISIDYNALNLAFEGGGDWRWKLNYTFQYQNKDWQLVKAGNYTYQNRSGEMNDKQYDFVNKKRKVTSGNTNHKTSDQQTTEQSLNIQSRRTFTSFKKPWTWQIGPDEYL